MNKVGLLAGVGRLPVEYVRRMTELGCEVAIIALVPGVDPELRTLSNEYREVPVGKIGKILEALREFRAKDVVMLGKVSKELIMEGSIIPDFRGMALLARVKDYKDDTLLLACVEELSKEGFNSLSQMEALQALIVEPGLYTKRAPDEREQLDMNFGLQVAHEIGGLDIGQTVVVKDRAVMAVEAIEGTDACILRGGALARGGAIVAKAAKPFQDHRFDVPTVGPDTILMMAQAGATGIVMEAGRTLLYNREKTVALAEEKGITMVSQNL